MTRRRRSRWQRIWDAWLRDVRLAFDGRARRRSEGSKRAWATRRRRARALEPLPSVGEGQPFGIYPETGGVGHDRTLTDRTTVNGRTP